MGTPHEPHPPHGAEAHAPHHAGPGFEARDASIRPIFTFGVALVLLIVAVQLGLYGVYRVFIRDREVLSGAKAKEPTNLYRQLKALRDAEAATLGSYGVVDPKRGVYRIPIDAALDRVARDGVPKGKGPRTEIELNGRQVPPTAARRPTDPALAPDEAAKAADAPDPKAEKNKKDQ